jgi:hypothetical protein
MEFNVSRSHCERSEAIQNELAAAPDCFVALPRSSP